VPRSAAGSSKPWPAREICFQVFGGPDNGRVLFKARMVLYLRSVTGQRFLLVRVMLGRSAYGPSTRRHRRLRVLRRSRCGQFEPKFCSLSRSLRNASSGNPRLANLPDGPDRLPTPNKRWALRIRAGIARSRRWSRAHASDMWSLPWC
jgi:hypothetical protein